MAKFIIGNSFKRIAEKYRVVRYSLWFVEAAVFWLFYALVSRLPVETASRLGQRLARAIGPRLKKHRTFRRNIDRAFPEKSDAERAEITLGIWGNLGAIIAEFPHLDRICHRERHHRLKVSVAGYIEALQPNSGKPAIVVAAHISNWEVAAAVVAEMGIPCADAYTPMGNPWLDRMMARFREPLGVELFPREESMKPMIRRLNEGKSLAFLMDQRVDNGKSVPFMGMDKMTTVVPAKLGLRFDCEIVPVRIERLADAQYLITFYPPVVADDTEASEPEKVLQITRKINDLLGQWVREKPQEWFPSKRRWDKIRPTTSSSSTAHEAPHESHVRD